MSILKGVLQEEYKRLKSLFNRYNKEIALFPKGSISIKKRNNRDYLYLVYREKGKIKFEYIGSVRSDKAKKVMGDVKERRKLEEKIKMVKMDIKELEKVLNGRRI